MLIARPDVQQQKLIEETRKAKSRQQGIVQIGADIKKFIEAEKDKSASQWGSDLGKFIEEQSMKLHGSATAAANSTAGGEGKKKMEGFGSEPAPVQDETEEKEDVRISAVLWKRRSGLGKHSTIKAWEKRRVELRGSKVMYYETPEEARQDQDANLDSGEQSPIPTTPKRVSLFEQAAQNAEQRIQTARDELSRMAQTVGLESFIPPSSDDVPRGILDIVKENATIGASIGHSSSPTPFCISIKVKSETKWKFCFDSHGMLLEWLTALNDVVVKSSVDAANEADEHNCQWEMQNYRLDLNLSDTASNQQSEHGSENVMTRTFSRQVTSESRSPIAVDAGGVVLNELHVKIILALSNFAILLSRSSVLSIERWWTLVIFFNFGMYQLYACSKSTKSLDRISPTDKPVSQITPTKKSRTNAIAGSSCIKVATVEDSNVTESGTKLPTWLPITSSDMEVRSRGYLTTKKKIPSPGELYECISVDCFQSDNRYSEMALRVVLPKVEFKDQGTKRWKSPDLFVVSWQLVMLGTHLF